MQVCVRNAACSLRQLRRVATRYQSTLPQPELEVNGQAPVPQHVLDIADQICKLSLLETGQLTKILKDKLGIGEISMAAPVAAAAAPVAAEPVEEEKKEKMYFDVKLASIDPSMKIKLIKAVKEIVPGINLVAAKKLVESAPCMIKENVAKSEAEELQKKLAEYKAEIVLE